MDKLIRPEHVDSLARVYVDFDRAFNRTHSRAAVDGGLLLLAIVDELRALRAAVEGQAEKSKVGR